MMTTILSIAIYLNLGISPLRSNVWASYVSTMTYIYLQQSSTKIEDKQWKEEQK